MGIRALSDAGRAMQIEVSNSEADLHREFRHTRGENLNRVQPLRPVRKVRVDDGTRVEQVEDVEIRVEFVPSYGKVPGQTEVHLVDPRLEGGAGLDQVHRDTVRTGRRACTRPQVPTE